MSRADRFFRLPSLVLPDPLAAIVEKELRSLARTPRFRTVFIMGFTFGLADYAAMLAVNEPPVVLASAQVKFLGPVVVGDRVEAEATLERSDGRKRWVRVIARRDGAPVLEAEFVAVVPDRHILDASPSREPRP